MSLVNGVVLSEVPARLCVQPTHCVLITSLVTGCVLSPDHPPVLNSAKVTLNRFSRADLGSQVSSIYFLWEKDSEVQTRGLEMDWLPSEVLSVL